MRQCFLSIAGHVEAFEVKLEGRGALPEIEVEVRHDTKWLRGVGWMKVHIGKKIDHIGSACNSGGAVYAATVLRKYGETGKQLF